MGCSAAAQRLAGGVGVTAFGKCICDCFIADTNITMTKGQSSIQAVAFASFLEKRPSRRLLNLGSIATRNK